jgi:hypothetical protein
MRVLVLLVLFAAACDRPPATTKPPFDMKKAEAEVDAKLRWATLERLEVKGQKELFLSAEGKLLKGEELTRDEKDLFAYYTQGALPEARERFEELFPNYTPIPWHKD